MASPTPESIPAPPGVIGTPSGPMPYVDVVSKDYPRLVFSAPRFEIIAIADIIQPSVTEAVQAVLPSLVPPYVNQAAQDAVNALAVRRVGDTMTGALMLSPAIPTAPTMAATKQYVDAQVSTAVPEVPPVPAGGSWARQTGQWVPLTGGGSVTSIATGVGLTGGPISTSGTISMANMAGSTLKGNNTGATASPVDLTVAQVMTLLNAAPLNSPAFTGTPQLPTGTAAITQVGGTNNTTVATTAFVQSTVAAQYPISVANGGTGATTAAAALTNLGAAPIASPVFTGNPTAPTPSVGDADTSVATTAFVANGFLPITGGTLSGPGNLTVRGGILTGAAGTVPAAGAMTLNANTVAPPAGLTGTGLYVVASDDGSVSGIAADGFGGAATNINLRRARGTAAAPTAVQNNDNLCRILSQARGATSYAQGAEISFRAAENWTDAAHGTSISLATTPLGTTSEVNSLTLQGNTATFSGNVTIPGNSSFYLNGGSSGVPGRISSDGTNMSFNMAGSGGAYHFVNFANTVLTLILDDSGNLTISGATATKASGTTWANPSSRDIKEDIQPYDKGLQAILALNPITYKFRKDSGIDAPGPHIGLVHDETKHMPEMHRTLTLGSGDDAREVDGIDCSAVTWALVNAIKELKAELDALKPKSKEK